MLVGQVLAIRCSVNCTNRIGATIKVLSLAGKNTHGLKGRLNYKRACAMLYIVDDVSIDIISEILMARDLFK